MSSKHAGSCLCGEIRFEIIGEFERFFLCHCGRCRKDTGSAHAANLFSSTAKLTWLSGQSKIKSFRVASTRHQKSFCGECGSALPNVQMNGALLVVPAGSLDSAVEAKPDAHIFVASSADWDRCLDDVQRIDGLPD
ncbi:MAG TPA: GFA family protein [Hyphomicrobium sp.]|nr:GFA family protein [Hyphomicrobium sp.]